MNPHHFLTMYIWDVLNVNANRMKLLLNNIQRCLNHVFLLEHMKITRVGKKPTQRWWRGPTTWKVMLQNAMSDSWQTKKVEQLCKVSSPCLDDHQFKQKELESVRELSQICSQIVKKKSLYLARIGWETRHSVVCPQTCKSSYNMDSGLRQTMGKIDFTQSSHN